jgi:hypothetical protein
VFRKIKGEKKKKKKRKWWDPVGPVRERKGTKE